MSAMDRDALITETLRAVRAAGAAAEAGDLDLAEAHLAIARSLAARLRGKAGRA